MYLSNFKIKNTLFIRYFSYCMLCLAQPCCQYFSLETLILKVLFNKSLTIRLKTVTLILNTH